MGDPRIAFTFGNGFFLKGQKDPARNIPLDRIFLGRRAFFAISDGEFCSFIMLHELAHFVGFIGQEVIGDNGRGWFTDPQIAQLSVDQRLHNADSYAGFADECRTGSSAKPRHVKAFGSSTSDPCRGRSPSGKQTVNSLSWTAVNAFGACFRGHP